MAADTLHPAENRGYRELFVFSQQLVGRWRRLSERIGDPDAAIALDKGVESTRRLLSELADRLAGYGLYGQPAARGLGARIAGTRSEVADRFLERNQAVRLAVTDLHRLRVLLDFLGAVAESRGDQALHEFCGAWERRLGRVEGPVRRAAVASGADPDRAVEPIDTSPAGQAAHRVSYAIGSLGEWVDANAARRRAK